MMHTDSRVVRAAGLLTVLGVAACGGNHGASESTHATPSTPLSLTLDQLDALGYTTVTLDEPFVEARQTFSGVPLSAVLASGSGSR